MDEFDKLLSIFGTQTVSRRDSPKKVKDASKILKWVIEKNVKGRWAFAGRRKTKEMATQKARRLRKQGLTVRVRKDVRCTNAKDDPSQVRGKM